MADLMGILNRNRVTPQPAQTGPLNIGFGTTINDLPNYNIGMSIDPALANQAQGFFGQISGAAAPINVGGASAGRATATTQEVEQDQLLSHHLNQLLAADSPYIQAARQRAEEQSARRGLMNSSMMAGAGERAAIESGLPIAGFDASRFGSVADQNMAAQNAMELGNLQSRTSLAAAGLQARTQAAIARSAQQNALNQMYLGHQLGGLDDYRRYMLGLEDREDTQAFQAGQSDIDRFIADRQFGGRLGLGYAQVGAQAWAGNQGAIMGVANDIFGNTQLTGEQQTAAWNNFIQNVMPSIANTSLATIPPHILGPIAGPNAVNAVARMPTMSGTSLRSRAQAGG